MTDAEQIALSEAYVALSNAHRLDYILPMFATEAIYRSSAVGEFVGRANIGEMMGRFFSLFPDVSWVATNYLCTEIKTVSFDFTMTANNIETGESVDRAGIESIQYNSDGYIQLLEVSTR